MILLNCLLFRFGFFLFFFLFFFFCIVLLPLCVAGYMVVVVVIVNVLLLTHIIGNMPQLLKVNECSYFKPKQKKKQQTN